LYFGQEIVLSSSFIAMGVAFVLVMGLVISVGVFSLLVGALETLFGKPKLTVLKPEDYEGGFAFAFDWNSSKEVVAFDGVKIRLFNPQGTPTHMEVYRKFDNQVDSFAAEVDMGKTYLKLLAVPNFEKTRVQVELVSSKDGFTYMFEMKGHVFKQRISRAQLTVKQFSEKYFSDEVSKGAPVSIPERSFVVDTVPGKGSQVALPTNPAFAAFFAGQGGGDGAAAGGEAATLENFLVSKVWIEPGCIVCNACEDIFPEVFDVTADTCLIRPGAPLEDGLRIEEAAEACPVEVIKFTKA
jgi:ferredoxin